METNYLFRSDWSVLEDKSLFLYKEKRRLLSIIKREVGAFKYEVCKVKLTTLRKLDNKLFMAYFEFLENNIKDIINYLQCL